MLALGNWRIEQGEPVAPNDLVEASRWQDSATSLCIAKLNGKAGKTYRLRMDPDFAVDAEPDGRIVIRQSRPVPQTTIDHFLADQVIPRLLAHQGSFVFHAGAVQLGGEAVVFMGLSGRGKSTLAKSFDLAGAPLMGDDAMVLSWADNIPHVSPVYPSLRLFPDSIYALIPDAATAGPVAHYSSKQRIEVEVAREPNIPALQVRALFAIAAPDQNGEVRIRDFSVLETCMALVEGSFALDPTDLDQARGRLAEASRLANSVTAFEISYPRDFARLPDVRSAIIERLGNRL